MLDLEHKLIVDEITTPVLQGLIHFRHAGVQSDCIALSNSQSRSGFGFFLEEDRAINYIGIELKWRSIHPDW